MGGKYGGFMRWDIGGYLQGEYLKVLYTDFYILPVSYKRGKYHILFIEHKFIIQNIILYSIYRTIFVILYILFIEQCFIYHNIFMVILYYIVCTLCMCHPPPIFLIYTWLSYNIRYTLKVHLPHTTLHFPHIVGEYEIKMLEGGGYTIYITC